jgi:hypothetical protein
MQGVNFLSILEEPSAVVRQVAFSEHNWHDYEAHGRSVRTDDGWLYIKNNRPQLPWQGPADSVRSPSHVSLQTLRDAPDDLSVAQKDVFRKPRPQEELFFTPDDPLQLKNLASIAEDAKTLKQMQMFLQTWTEETCDSIPMTISHDQFDRETGKPLHPKSKSKDWFRGTPAGWDRKADHTLEHGPT